MTDIRAVGQTASAGFQIGVRRTFPITAERAWSLLTSREGLCRWLGDAPSLEFVAGRNYSTTDGASGQIRVVKPPEQLRLTWKKSEWARPSTVQIRCLPASAGKTTVSFHQENLADSRTREEMKIYWEGVAAWIKTHAEQQHE